MNYTNNYKSSFSLFSLFAKNYINQQLSYVNFIVIKQFIATFVFIINRIDKRYDNLQ